MPSARYTPRSCAAPAVQVWPSFGASSALFVPMEPDAPGWLTITTFWPRCFSSSAAVMRVTWSVEPPAAQGTMIVTGLEGFQFCAWTPVAASTAIKTNKARFMSSPYANRFGRDLDHAGLLEHVRILDYRGPHHVVGLLADGRRE